MYINVHQRLRQTPVWLGCQCGMYLAHVIGLVLCVLSSIAASQQISDEWAAQEFKPLIEPLVKIRPILQTVRKSIDRSQFDRD